MAALGDSFAEPQSKISAWLNTLNARPGYGPKENTLIRSKRWSWTLKRNFWETRMHLSYAAWGLNKHTLGKIVLDFRITECKAIFLV